MWLPTLLLAGLPGVSAAADTPAPKADYTDLAKLIHATIVPQLPKEVEDRSGWGKTIPDPGNLKFPRLRERIKVGDHEELPDGAWSRTRLWLDDPARDVQVEVRELSKVDPATVRLQLAVTVTGHGERERRHYEKGLHLFGLNVQADAVVVLVLDCDVKLGLNTSKFPPEVTVAPKVTKSRIELKEFDLRKVGKLKVGERTRELGNELKGVLQDQLKKYDPVVQEKLNAAIAHGLKEGKGSVSAGALLKAEPKKEGKP